MQQNIIQISGGIAININASVKKTIYVKNNMFGILAHVTVKMKYV